MPTASELTRLLPPSSLRLQDCSRQVRRGCLRLCRLPRLGSKGELSFFLDRRAHAPYLLCLLPSSPTPFLSCSVSSRLDSTRLNTLLSSRVLSELTLPCEFRPRLAVGRVLLFISDVWHSSPLCFQALRVLLPLYRRCRLPRTFCCYRERFVEPSRFASPLPLLTLHALFSAVGVSAYLGAASLITDPAYVTVAG